MFLNNNKHILILFTKNENLSSRIVWADVVRLLAIFMIICAHCADPFNVSPQARLNPDFNFWGTIYGSLLRPCVPLFVISVLLLYLFAGVLKWLPTYGLSTWKHYILPVTCLSFSPIAYIARMTRSSMLEVMQQDYIRTARAKGVAERMVILKHGLRNAILPVVTYLGTLIANLLTGSFIVERLFAIPGLGKYFVDSITARDYNIIMGVTIFLGVFVVACNLLVDVVYGVIDPRVKLDE